MENTYFHKQIRYFFTMGIFIRSITNGVTLLVIRSAIDVLRAQSRFVKFMGVRPQAEPPTHFTTYFGSDVRQ